MPTALPLTDKISQVSQASRNYRIKAVQYGNGYSQRAKDGINNVQDAWNITYRSLSSTDYTTLMNALNTYAATGDHFTWTAPIDTVSKKWILSESVAISKPSGNYYTVSFTLTQVFDV